MTGGTGDAKLPGMGRKKKASEVQEAGPRFRRDMLVADAVDADLRVKDILEARGLPCHRCVVAFHETLEQGCAPLGIDTDAVVAELNALDET